MTFWLFRKPRLYRILAPLEPQPRPAPRRGTISSTTISSTGRTSSSRRRIWLWLGVPLRRLRRRKRRGTVMGWLFGKIEGPRSIAVDVQ